MDQAEEAGDRLEGEEDAVLGQPHREVVTREEAQQRGLLGERPVAVAGRQPVGWPPAGRAEALPQVEPQRADRTLDRRPAGRVEEIGLQELPPVGERRHLRLQPRAEREGEGDRQRAVGEQPADRPARERDSLGQHGPPGPGGLHAHGDQRGDRVDQRARPCRHPARRLPDRRRHLVAAAVARQPQHGPAIEARAGRLPPLDPSRLQGEAHGDRTGTRGGGPHRGGHRSACHRASRTIAQGWDARPP
jgi:hypothetical protein